MLGTNSANFCDHLQAKGDEHSKGSCRIGDQAEGSRHQHYPAELHRVVVIRVKEDWMTKWASKGSRDRLRFGERSRNHVCT